MPNNRIVRGASTWNFVKISGNPDLPGMELEAIEKHGVDGVAFREMQFRADSTPLYLQGIGVNFADMQLFVANMKNLQGTQVLLYTATGLSYNGVAIEKVTLLSTKACHVQQWLGVSFPNSYRIQWQFTVRYPYGSF